MRKNSAQHAPLRGLYAIADTATIPPAEFLPQVEAALRGGARLVQYRDKSDDAERRLAQATALRQLCDEHDALLIINDDYLLCDAVGADGVHLGRGDTALGYVRDKLGDEIIIGASCYNAISLAETAAERGASYVAFGAFFPSPTKPGAVRAFPWHIAKAQAAAGLPVCAIGGITSANAPLLVEAGADLLAVITGIFNQPDVEAAARRIAALYETT